MNKDNKKKSIKLESLLKNLSSFLKIVLSFVNIRYNGKK